MIDSKQVVECCILKGTSISPFNVVNFGNVFEQTVCVDWCGNNKCEHWRSCLLALGCDAEAVLCYEKVLTDFKNLKGDNHRIVTLAYVNLAVST